METSGRSRGARCSTAARGKNFRDLVRRQAPSTRVDQSSYYIANHVPQKAVSLDGVDELFLLPGYLGGKDRANAGFF